MTVNRRIFLVAFAASMLFMLVPVVAQAQQKKTEVANESAPPGFVFTPFVVLSTAYNDNVFLKAQPESDTILRLNPGFIMTYHSKRTYFDMGYSLAADKYTRYSELLNSWHDEQKGFLDIKRQFTDRFNAGIGASYFQTHNPGQLTPTAGLVLARTKSTQTTVVPSFTYELSNVNFMNVFYNWTRYDQSSGLITNVGTAAAGIVHTLSPRDSLEFQVQNITYHSSNGEDATSNLATVGWTRAISRETSLVLSAGPRRTEGSTVPEVSAALRYDTDATHYSITYSRSQAAVIGQAGVNNVQGLGMSFGFNPTHRLSIGFSPSYFHYYGSNLNAYGYHAGFYTTYFFSPAWALSLTYDYAWQNGNTGTSVRPVVLRQNIVALALQWALPGPGDRYRNSILPFGAAPVLSQ
ncbi:MAG: hypothetical protein ACREBW_04840 [Candidatus Micrarchaeaceae archaeon]